MPFQRRFIVSLIVKSFICNAFQENTYVISRGKECIILDPGCSNDDERNDIMNYMTSHQLIPVKLFNTHSHIDHVLGCAWVYEHYKLAPHIHEQDYIVYQAQDQVAKAYGFHLETLPKELVLWNHSHESVKVLGFDCQILETPGHSPGHVCYYWPEPGILMSGDCLFKGSIGRLDLPGGNHKQMLKSLKKLARLPGHTKVYSGHGEPTTIAQEIRDNPYLQSQYLC
ncbi:MAG: MBL fold metallo-hydrolase [Pseudomonadota bacterium]|nr:MBL fold metallo-hydrolase [Pseudomonadota bacterium]